MKILGRISCRNFVELHEYIYFSNWFYNGLFKVETKTGQTTFLGYFEDEKTTEKNIHVELMVKEEKIYFIPRKGRHLHIYDLSSQTMSSIEVRKNSDPFFKNTIFKEKYFIFFPFEEDGPVRKLDLMTQKITDINNKMEFQGEFLSKNEDIFPGSELVGKYDIRLAKDSLWKKILNGKWCAFLPEGAQMLWYTDGVSKLEIMPLVVTNEIELKNYLYKIKQEFWKERVVLESDLINIRELGQELVTTNILNYQDFESNNNFGKKIWGMLK